MGVFSEKKTFPLIKVDAAQIRSPYECESEANGPPPEGEAPDTVRLDASRGTRIEPRTLVFYGPHRGAASPAAVSADNVARG
jgi:hypothetical protein